MVKERERGRRETGRRKRKRRRKEARMREGRRERRMEGSGKAGRQGKKKEVR